MFLKKLFKFSTYTNDHKILRIIEFCVSDLSKKLKIHLVAKLDTRYNLILSLLRKCVEISKNMVKALLVYSTELDNDTIL